MDESPLREPEGGGFGETGGPLLDENGRQKKPASETGKHYKIKYGAMDSPLEADWKDADTTPRKALRMQAIPFLTGLAKTSEKSRLSHRFVTTADVKIPLCVVQVKYEPQ